MPSIRRKSKRQRREWTDAHRLQLQSGYDWFGEAWGNVTDLPMPERHKWPLPDVRAEMRDAWTVFGAEINAEYADKIERAWGWWRFDAPESRDESLPESAQLERLGLLTAAAIASAQYDAIQCGGIMLAFSCASFRRSWHWWRFISPERRNYDIPEAVQLAKLDQRVGEVLDERERYIVKHKADMPKFDRFKCPSLTSEEAAALELPDSFVW